jgi:hypothetical protein
MAVAVSGCYFNSKYNVVTLPGLPPTRAVELGKLPAWVLMPLAGPTRTERIVRPEICP